MTKNKYNAFCIAGTHSGVGKTTITLGLLAALKQRSMIVQPFKCGPDYIDTSHHAIAAGLPSRNLDTWIMSEAGVFNSHAQAIQNADVAVIEGVMGLFDGASSNSREGSTAHVCGLLDLPVVLVVNAKAMARSIAALVHGFATFDPDIKIIGIIANNVSSNRHAQILREALSAAGLPPLLGTVPGNPEWAMEERHLGLITAAEGTRSSDWFSAFAEVMEKHVDIDKLLALSNCKRPQYDPDKAHTLSGAAEPVRIGIAYDEAFQFYYEDNLDMMRQCGAKLIPFSPLSDSNLPPDIDGLYIGGGFPEISAEKLSSNLPMRNAISDFAMQGGYIYAECGGLMYLCKSLKDQHGCDWPMCNVLPANTTMEQKLHRLGYVQVKTLQNSIFGPAGTVLRGHEFHWSSTSIQDMIIPPLFESEFAGQMGIKNHAGFQVNNTFASYIHLHFASNPDACQSWIDTLRCHKSRPTLQQS